MNTRTFGLQKETRNYLRRLYTYGRELSPVDVNDIDDFIKGLKQLSLWGNTVCWLMRSKHNIGSGSSVFSIGGSNQYNATLVNSPTWGINGIDTSGSTNRLISTPAVFDQSKPHSIIWVGNATDTSRFRTFFDTNRGSPNRVVVSRSTGSQNVDVYAGNITITNIGASPISSFFGVGVSVDSANSKSMIGGTVSARVLGPISPLSGAILIGNSVGANTSCGNNSVFLYIKNSIGDAMSDVYKLLKFTVCKDQGLL